MNCVVPVGAGQSSSSAWKVPGHDEQMTHLWGHTRVPSAWVSITQSRALLPPLPSPSSSFLCPCVHPTPCSTGMSRSSESSWVLQAPWLGWRDAHSEVMKQRGGLGEAEALGADPTPHLTASPSPTSSLCFLFCRVGHSRPHPQSWGCSV